MNYKIVCVKYCTLEAGTKVLEEKVNELLKEGWQLQGSVSISMCDDYYYSLAQSMVLL